MAEHIFKLEGPRPYFAEVAYYIWGQVNYHSEGDCGRPTDRDWSRLYLKHRETGVSLDIEHVGDSCEFVVPTRMRLVLLIFFVSMVA